jgi:hypothetical protein
MMTAQREGFLNQLVKRSVDRDKDNGTLQRIIADIRCNAGYEF